MWHTSRNTGLILNHACWNRGVSGRASLTRLDNKHAFARFPLTPEERRTLTRSTEGITKPGPGIQLSAPADSVRIGALFYLTLARIQAGMLRIPPPGGDFRRQVEARWDTFCRPDAGGRTPMGLVDRVLYRPGSTHTATTHGLIGDCTMERTRAQCDAWGVGADTLACLLAEHWLDTLRSGTWPEWCAFLARSGRIVTAKDGRLMPETVHAWRQRTKAPRSFERGA